MTSCPCPGCTTHTHFAAHVPVTAGASGPTVGAEVGRAPSRPHADPASASDDRLTGWRLLAAWFGMWAVSWLVVLGFGGLVWFVIDRGLG